MFRRLREFRTTQTVRDTHSEVSLHPTDFIHPFFVVSGQGVRKEIGSLEGVYHLSVDELLIDIAVLQELGIDKVLLFGVVEEHLHSAEGGYSADENSPVVLAVAAIKKDFPKMTVMTDICICGYTDHGHCGFVQDEVVLNDESLPALAEMALAHARAGADYVAPSAMMDGQVWAIRQLLDQHGFHAVRIMSYSAKYASSFYGPFRDAVDSTPSFGDRKTYQMDFRNRSQALWEVEADLQEGAVATMVKPAMCYLDIASNIKRTYPQIPLAGYHVSGEYMLIKHAAKAGAIDELKALEEVFYSFKRAGIDWIISYAARSFVQSMSDARVV